MIKLLLKIPTYLSQLIEIVPLHVEGNQFIRDNKLWQGLFRLKWVLWLSIGLGLIISFMFISTFSAWVTEMYFGEFHGSSMLASISLFSSMEFFGDRFFFDGSLKYLILIFVEVIIFHCTINTLNILSGENHKPQFADFINAEKRMIQVSFMAWIFELVAGILVAVFLSIIGLEGIKKIVLLFIEFYFIGHLFLDNYNEQYGLSIKESFYTIRDHAGAAIGVGFVAYVLFLIPIVGLIVAPILGAVTGAMYMYSNKVNAELDRQFELV